MPPTDLPNDPRKKVGYVEEMKTEESEVENKSDSAKLQMESRLQSSQSRLGLETVRKDINSQSELQPYSQSHSQSMLQPQSQPPSQKQSQSQLQPYVQPQSQNQSRSQLHSPDIPGYMTTKEAASHQRSSSENSSKSKKSWFSSFFNIKDKKKEVVIIPGSAAHIQNKESNSTSVNQQYTFAGNPPNNQKVEQKRPEIMNSSALQHSAIENQGSNMQMRTNHHSNELNSGRHVRHKSNNEENKRDNSNKQLSQSELQSQKRPFQDQRVENNQTGMNSGRKKSTSEDKSEVLTSDDRSSLKERQPNKKISGGISTNLPIQGKPNIGKKTNGKVFMQGGSAEIHQRTFEEKKDLQKGSVNSAQGFDLSNQISNSMLNASDMSADFSKIDQKKSLLKPIDTSKKDEAAVVGKRVDNLMNDEIEELDLNDERFNFNFNTKAKTQLKDNSTPDLQSANSRGITISTIFTPNN